MFIPTTGKMKRMKYLRKEKKTFSGNVKSVI